MTVELRVEGMSCGHCVRAVTAAITTFSVAPTDTIGKLNRPPASRPPGAEART